MEVDLIKVVKIVLVGTCGSCATAVVDGCSSNATNNSSTATARVAYPGTTVRPGCRMVCDARGRRHDVVGRTPTMLCTGESGYTIVSMADSFTMSFLA